MSKGKFLIGIVVSFIIASSMNSNPVLAADASHPCEQIKQACIGAGFVVKEVKLGIGLWRDCINPLIQGTKANNSVKPLPVVDPSIISACKLKNPKFGEGKVGK